MTMDSYSKSEYPVDLCKEITPNSNPDFNQNLYLFTNKEGGLSLITPNYGNVSDDQRDVMLEVLQ